MDNSFDKILKSVSLFKRLSDQEIVSILGCLTPKKKKYKKEEYILLAGDQNKEIGIILSGKVHILREDYLGHRHILTTLAEGDLFAEVYVCAHVYTIPVTIYAVSDCEVLFIDYQRILTSCSSACTFHTSLIENMLSIIAQKNIMLNQKIEFLTKRSTREKLLAYLYQQADKVSSNKFYIPLNRQELADFLCVDRSAMSNELCKLRDEGLLNFQKNFFELLGDDY